jgi:hypothetical protein
MFANTAKVIPACLPPVCQGAGRCRHRQTQAGIQGLDPRPPFSRGQVYPREGGDGGDGLGGALASFTPLRESLKISNRNRVSAPRGKVLGSKKTRFQRFKRGLPRDRSRDPRRARQTLSVEDKSERTQAPRHLIDQPMGSAPGRSDLVGDFPGQPVARLAPRRRKSIGGDG